MENKDENINEDNESILSDLSSINEDKNYENNLKLLNNCYTCNKCNSIPEITNIDFMKNTIEINCSKHKNEIKLVDFINGSLKNHYFFSVCNICNKNIQKNNDNIFKYCYDCKKVICETCYLNHNNGHKIINNNEYYNKCQKHFNEIYTSFCSDCRENICLECKKSKFHLGHKKYDFIEIIPTEDEINYIKDFSKKIEINLEQLNVSGKKEIEELTNCKNDLLIKIAQKYQNKNQKIKQETENNMQKNLQIFEKKKKI